MNGGWRLDFRPQGAVGGALAVHPAGVGAADAEGHVTATVGMWVFLTTETLFFGVLFLAYAMGRWHFGDAFAVASRHTNVVLGTANTAVLLTSSLAMALSARAAQMDRRRATQGLLALTLLLGLAFLGIKLAEYGLDFREHLVPGAGFAITGPAARGAAFFFAFYFASTGLHALHLGIGIALVGFMLWRVTRRGTRNEAHAIEVTGLYWHFVDVVWIFLYPSLYLLGRAA